MTCAQRIVLFIFFSQYHFFSPSHPLLFPSFFCHIFHLSFTFYTVHPSLICPLFLHQLRRYFPSQASVMPTLPEKDFFNYLDAHVVDKRRRALEEYMTRIVQRLPTVSRLLSLSLFIHPPVHAFLHLILYLTTVKTSICQ